jgi:hypothetical protein
VVESPPKSKYENSQNNSSTFSVLSDSPARPQSPCGSFQLYMVRTISPAPASQNLHGLRRGFSIPSVHQKTLRLRLSTLCSLLALASAMVSLSVHVSPHDPSLASTERPHPFQSVKTKRWGWKSILKWMLDHYPRLRKRSSVHEYWRVSTCRS